MCYKTKPNQTERDSELPNFSDENKMKEASLEIQNRKSLLCIPNMYFLL